MLDPRSLQALAAVVDQGSFAAAARALNLTLAAVSQRIKLLEEQMGQRLLVRGKPLRPTPAGEVLLAHIRQVQLMEAEVLARLQRGGAAETAVPWQSLSVAINADSLASWFLPAVAELLRAQRLLLDIRLDDQDHTHAALKSGEVLGCVTTLAQPMHGCVAEPLGIMRYHCVAAPAVAQAVRGEGEALSPHRLLAHPAVIFNRKDGLQDAFLAQHLGLRSPAYPRHFVPAVDGFEAAIAMGLGWGMVPEQQLARWGAGRMVELLPGATVDVALYWQHWEREAPAARRLTEAVQAAARQALRPLPAA